MKEETSIGKLAEEAGVSVRTIRFYIDQGLLPPPRIHGRRTVYDQEYLDRLKLIRRLKEAYLPLREIQQKMAGLTIEMVRHLLYDSPQPVKSEERLPDKNIAPEGGISRGKDPAGVALPNGENAAQYIARILEAHSDSTGIRRSRPFSNPYSNFPLSESLPTAAPVLPSETNSNTASPVILPGSDAHPQTSQPSNWLRIIIIPGVEIHVNDKIYNDNRAAVKRLIEWARQLFLPRRA